MDSKAPSGSHEITSGPQLGLPALERKDRGLPVSPLGDRRGGLGVPAVWTSEQGGLIQSQWVNMGDAQHADYTYLPLRRRWHPLQYLAWKIPWTEEPGRLHSMESRRVGHD